MRITAFFVYCIGILLLTSCVSQQKFTEIANERNSLAERATTLETELNKSTDRVESLSRENGRLEERIRVVGTTVTELEGANAVLKKEVKQANTALLAERQKLATANQGRAAQEEKRSQQLLQARREVELKTQVLQEVQTKLEAFAQPLGSIVSLKQTPDAVVLTVSTNSLLRPNLTISSNAPAILQPLAELLKTQEMIHVLVVGHTSSSTIRQRFIKDSWDASVLQATAVVRMLTESYGVDPKEITAAGNGNFLPIANNNSKSGQAKNQRIEIHIRPKLDALYEQMEGTK